MSSMPMPTATAGRATSEASDTWQSVIETQIAVVDRPCQQPKVRLATWTFSHYHR